jgi:glycosyltransferase involved in cell wall biosynthesis
LTQDVVDIGYMSHEEIVLAYNAADVMVYPSSYEGFGMPVLEAMACGTPVVTLDNTAFPEFAGGVARLLPDADVGTLARGIVAVLFDREERERMAGRGPVRAAKYDWRTISEKYLDLLVGLARNRWVSLTSQPLPRASIDSPEPDGSIKPRQSLM